MVDRAVENGARALTGGSRIEGEGFFYQPTLLVDVAPDDEIMTDELF